MSYPKDMHPFRDRVDLLSCRVASHYLGPRYVRELQNLADEIASFEASGLTKEPIKLWLAWRDLFGAGIQWSEHIIDKLDIPSKKSKAVEMAARAFAVDYGAKKPKAGILAWYHKNLRYLKVLEEATTWPDRKEGILKIGPFNVHDTLGSPKEVEKAREIIDIAMRKIRGIAPLQRWAYGNLYLVGKIDRPKWAAWYIQEKDAIYLRPKIAGIGIKDSALHLIHEIAHRWWRKDVPNSVKEEWTDRHTELSQAGKFRIPEEGEVFPSWYLVNGKTVKIGPRTGAGIQLLDAKTNKPFVVAGFDDLLKMTKKISTVASFPTIYAASAPEEHFAEAVAMKAMGILPQEHAKALKTIVGI